MSESIAASFAHQIAAELARTLMTPPDQPITAGAITDTGLKIVITIARYDGPAKLWLRPGVELMGMVGPPVPPCQTRNLNSLREIEKCALEAAPKADEKGISVKVLSRLAGYSYSSYFREAVRALVEMGLLRRANGGVKRA